MWQQLAVRDNGAGVGTELELGLPVGSEARCGDWSSGGVRRLASCEERAGPGHLGKQWKLESSLGWFLRPDFLSNHAPLLLEYKTHTARPAIPLWRLRPDILGDTENKKDLQEVLVGYFLMYWGTAGTRGLEWEALKVVIRGESLSKTYGTRQRLDQELTRQGEVLATLQRQADNGDTQRRIALS
ncbi:hypothetical protein NDU88_004163 [Pleurodeles waltl]|uniref:Uncharacterized protein n=1 Tax=Pleurodeles waltl TaxID=8319 RepID=A0AAV7M7J6_PLEWA|nr:hypothetical protein NDU88_004163 [Pleurodeles waltl]